LQFLALYRWPITPRAWRDAYCLRADFENNESKQDVQNSSLLKAVEFFGAAGEFCCHSLHRSQISNDL
jgi:hypothetical protein